MYLVDLRRGLLVILGYGVLFFGCNGVVGSFDINWLWFNSFYR